MKNIVLSCLAVAALVSMVGCADDNKPVTTNDSSATMSSDTKDMTPVHHHHHAADAAAPAPAPAQ